MHIVFNHRLVLVCSVIVGRDAARAEIDALANGGVAQICQVVGLGTTGQARIFDFNKVADMHVRTQVCAGAKACKGADARIRTHAHAQGFAINMG